MTERRPHWDDDLIEAVKAASTKYGAGTVDSAYATIAAVEDWIDARGSAIDGREVVAAIAAVARVRDVCEQDSFWINHAKTGGWGKALTVAQVLAALEGDSDE